MIDVLTGDFQTDDGFVLGRLTNEQEFLVSAVGRLSTNEGHNEGWSRYGLPRPQMSDSIEWDCFAVFKNGMLIRLLLTTYDPTTKGWADWSETKQLLKKERHDKILRRILGPPPYKYGWGEVFSSYDPRSGSAHVTISYALP